MLRAGSRALQSWDIDIWVDVVVTCYSTHWVRDSGLWVARALKGCIVASGGSLTFTWRQCRKFSQCGPIGFSAFLSIKTLKDCSILLVPCLVSWATTCSSLAYGSNLLRFVTCTGFGLMSDSISSESLKFAAVRFPGRCWPLLSFAVDWQRTHSLTRCIVNGKKCTASDTGIGYVRRLTEPWLPLCENTR